jgi:glucose-6-phosphate isomerase, archaeal
MKDLKKISGLDIKFEDIGLTYDQNTYPTEPKVRTYDEAQDVYVEKNSEEQDLYFMYRYFEDTNNTQKFIDANTEYDITVIKPGKIGKEFIKTAGHYHRYVPQTEITYPEVYEVIAGQVEYLLQTKPDVEGNVDVVIISAEPGDKVIIPPNYGHVSINTGGDYLVESNLQLRDLPADADYETFQIYGGGGLYREEKGWENNPQYKIRSLKRVRPKENLKWGLSKDKPLYTCFIESPEKFKWLTEPQNYDFSDVWDKIEKF